jgi:hypothetical protein
VSAAASPFRTHTLARRVATVLAAIAPIAAVSLGAADGHSAATTHHAVAAPKPGLIGNTITIGKSLQMTGGAYDIVTDHSGTAYLGWISVDPDALSAGRVVHLCVLPAGATGCRGGVQTTPSLDESSAGNLRILAVPGGPVTFVWFDEGSETGEITESTVQSNGTLSDATQVATAPANGVLLDAEVGPSNQIWTVSAGSEAVDNIQVHQGISNPPVTIHTPYGVADAALAFAGATPVIAIHKAGAITQPVGYTYLSHGSWTSVANVARTWTSDANIGLVATKSGVRLIASQADADYHPVIAKWNGHGFSAPILTGDKNNASPSSHDLVADASGRAADVSIEISQIAVANLADTVHAGIVRFPARGTTAGSNPQIATNPRGDSWVAWSVETSDSAEADTLYVSRLLLPGLHHSVSHRGSHGTVTVTGPASCLPADAISVGVKGHPKHGWKVASHTLVLGHKKLTSSLNGASLKPGKKYALKGTVVFAKGHGHQKVSAKLKFRSCPAP